MPCPRLVPPEHPIDRLIGQSPAIATLRVHIRHLASFDTIGSPLVPTVLLQGETGTGKGMVVSTAIGRSLRPSIGRGAPSGLVKQPYPP